MSINTIQDGHTLNLIKENADLLKECYELNSKIGKLVHSNSKKLFFSHHTELSEKHTEYAKSNDHLTFNKYLMQKRANLLWHSYLMNK